MDCLLCEDGNLISAIYNSHKEWDIFCSNCGPATVEKKYLTAVCPVCKEPALFDNWKVYGSPSDYGVYTLCFRCKYDSRNYVYCPDCKEKALVNQKNFSECLACGFIADADYEELPY